MYTKKFAIMNVIGNDEIILKTFTPDEKEQAIAYGEEVIKRDFTGVIVCAIIRVDENGNKAGNSAQVFRVWEREDREAMMTTNE